MIKTMSIWHVTILRIDYSASLDDVGVYHSPMSRPLKEMHGELDCCMPFFSESVPGRWHVSLSLHLPCSIEISTEV